MTWRAFGRMMAAHPLPRPKIEQSWVEYQGVPMNAAHSGEVVLESGRRRMTSPYGNVRRRGTV